jgi:hypothetical protein
VTRSDSIVSGMERRVIPTLTCDAGGGSKEVEPVKSAGEGLAGVEFFIEMGCIYGLLPARRLLGLRLYKDVPL